MNEDSQSPLMLWGLVGCAAFLIFGLCATAGIGVYMFTTQPKAPLPIPPPGPAVPQIPPPSSSLQVMATIVSNTDSKPSVGERCTFRVEEIANPDQVSGYWCHTRFRCGGRDIYGGPSNGYFPCTITRSSGTSRAEIVGQDSETTATDTDASFELNTVAGTLAIADDSTGALGTFKLVAKIDDVR